MMSAEASKCICEAEYGGVHCELDAAHCNHHGVISVFGEEAAVEDPLCSCHSKANGRHCECGPANDDDPTVPGPDWYVKPISTSGTMKD